MGNITSDGWFYLFLLCLSPPLFPAVDFFTAVKEGKKSVVVSYVQRYPKKWKTARDEVQGIVESRGYSNNFTDHVTSN